jgi:hypothetical protein
VLLDGIPLTIAFDTSGRGSASWYEGDIAACKEPIRLRPLETLGEVACWLEVSWMVRVRGLESRLMGGAETPSLERLLLEDSVLS